MPLSLGVFELLAAFAGRSWESGAADVAKESFRALSSLVVWRGGDAMRVQLAVMFMFPQEWWNTIPTVVRHSPRFCLSRFALTLVSSNGRHLKSFLYPPHSTLRFAHCWQPGFSSPHFSRLCLHVTQPAKMLHQYVFSLPAFAYIMRLC
jgi:hypothetical protein